MSTMNACLSAEKWRKKFEASKSSRYVSANIHLVCLWKKLNQKEEVEWSRLEKRAVGMESKNYIQVET